MKAKEIYEKIKHLRVSDINKKYPPCSCGYTKTLIIRTKFPDTSEIHIKLCPNCSNEELELLEAWKREGIKKSKSKRMKNSLYDKTKTRKVVSKKKGLTAIDDKELKKVKGQATYYSTFLSLIVV